VLYPFKKDPPPRSKNAEYNKPLNKSVLKIDQMDQKTSKIIDFLKIFCQKIKFCPALFYSAACYIFLTKCENVKLGDFGIARVLQHTCECAKTAIGTPYYLSPEICMEKPYDYKSDIWSLGCVLYEMTTLKHAFDDSSMRGLIRKILKGTYPSIDARFSDNLRFSIAEMLNREPNDRPDISMLLRRKFIAIRIQSLTAEAVSQVAQNKKVIETTGTATNEHGEALDENGNVTRFFHSNRSLKKIKKIQNKTKNSPVIKKIVLCYS